MPIKLDYKILKLLIDSVTLDKSEVILDNLLEELAPLYYSKGNRPNAKGISHLHRKNKSPYSVSRLKDVERRIKTATSNYLKSEGWKRDYQQFQVKYVIDGEIIMRTLSRIVYYRGKNNVNN